MLDIINSYKSNIRSDKSNIRFSPNYPSTLCFQGLIPTDVHIDSVLEHFVLVLYLGETGNRDEGSNTTRVSVSLTERGHQNYTDSR